MPTVNHATRIRSSKPVYYGAERSGNSSNCSHPYSSLPEAEVSVSLGSIGPYQIRFERLATPALTLLQGMRPQQLKDVGADDMSSVTGLSAVLQFSHAPEFGATAIRGDGVIGTVGSLGTLLLQNFDSVNFVNDEEKISEIDFDGLGCEMQKTVTQRRETAT